MERRADRLTVGAQASRPTKGIRVTRVRSLACGPHCRAALRSQGGSVARRKGGEQPARGWHDRRGRSTVVCMHAGCVTEPVYVWECVVYLAGPMACCGAEPRVDRHRPASARDPWTGNVEEAKVVNEGELGETGRVREGIDDAGVLEDLGEACGGVVSSVKDRPWGRMVVGVMVKASVGIWSRLPKGGPGRAVGVAGIEPPDRGTFR